MEYVGIQTQIWRNNTRSILLLLCFPAILLCLTWIFLYFIAAGNVETADGYAEVTRVTTFLWLKSIPWIAIFVILWFVIAWFSHTAMIARATGAKPLERKENKRVYNLVENLCIAAGMKMPRIYIIEDDSLNAYAAGIDERSYMIALSRGLINKLDDAELEAVIAHELTHIRNRDTRLMVIAIIFVGIFAFIAEMAFRSLRYTGGMRSRGKKGNGAVFILLLAMVLALIGYFLSLVTRFAISRKREYMADAGAAMLTRNPRALASALRKIATDPRIEAVKRRDVAQLFIEHPGEKSRGIAGIFDALFATHPPIEKRIAILEQF